VHTPADVKKMMSTNPKDKYWTALWQDLEAKVLNGVTNGPEIYRCFSSELEEMAKHSPTLKKILTEERAKRDHVSETVTVAAVEALTPAEKKQMRKTALAKLSASSVAPEDALADALSRDGEPLGDKPGAAE
jgi:glucan phosphorylase